jgi:hypothetical protein
LFSPRGGIILKKPSEKQQKNAEKYGGSRRFMDLPSKKMAFDKSFSA